MPGRFSFPIELGEAMMVELTGWPPSVLDEQPSDRLQKVLIVKNVLNVVRYGGEYDG